MKILLLISVFLIPCFVGVFIKRKYSMRVKVLRDALLFCEILISSITFIRKPIPDIISENKHKFTKEFANMLDNLKADSGYLKNENSTLNNLFENLGKTDVFNQKDLISNTSAELSSKLKQAGEDNIKKGSGMLKLCLCLAVAFVIILL